MELEAVSVCNVFQSLVMIETEGRSQKLYRVIEGYF